MTCVLGFCSVKQSFSTAGTIPGKGSDASAAGGGESELSEWQRSTDAKALRRRRQMSGTATGKAVTTSRRLGAKRGRRLAAKRSFSGSPVEKGKTPCARRRVFPLGVWKEER